MTQNETARFTPVIYLDTCAIHCLRLYMGFLIEKQLPPFGGNQASIDTLIPQQKTDHLRKTLKRGGKILNHLKEQNETARIQYSPATAMETQKNLLKGKAIWQYASDCLPDRFWNRLDEPQVFANLSQEDYVAVQDIWPGFEEQLSKNEISIEETPYDDIRSAMVLSRKMLGVIYVDVIDCFIYACALQAEADEIVTIDGYFSMIINGVRNFGGHSDEQYFKWAQDHIRKSWADVTGQRAEDIRFPLARKFSGS